VYDTAGFLPYLAFDGLDDSMSTNSIDFSAGDKMTVWAGIRRLSAAAFGVLSELSVNYNSNNGSFLFAAPEGASNDIGFGLRGASTYSTASFTDATAPSTSVLSVGADKALTTNEIEYMRRNGTAQALFRLFNQDTAGNFGNYPMFIGGRNNASVFFNGWLTSLIIRGAQSTQSQIEATEAWVNSRTGAY
jgi:hypothetical protein